MVAAALWWPQRYGGRSAMVAAALWWPQRYGGRSAMVAAALWWPQRYGGRSAMVAAALWWPQRYRSRSATLAAALKPAATIELMISIQAVLFDYGMVLSGPPDPAAQAHMEHLLDVPAERFSAAYWQYRDAYDRGALSGESYWSSVAKNLGRPLSPQVLAGLIAADTALWTQPNPAMIAWAAALQRAGIKTGILSNLGDAMELGIRQRFAWLEQFHHHTFSHRLGIAKPDPEIYRHAAQGLGTAPGHILFIDDREENIRAARDAGMQAVQYSGHAAFIQEMQLAGWGDLLASPARVSDSQIGKL